MKAGFRRVYALLWREVRIGNSIADLLSAIMVVILYVLGFALTLSNVFERAIVYRGLEVQYMVFVAPGIIALGTFMLGFNRSFAVTRLENANGLLALFIVAGVKPFEYLAARTFNYTLTLSMELILVTGINYAIYGYIPNLFCIALSVIALVTYTWMWVCLGVLLGLKVKSEYKRDLIFMFTGTPVMLTSTAYYPREAMPPPLRIISYLNPGAYATNLVRDLYLGLPPPVLDLAATIVLLIVFTIAAYNAFTNYSYR